MAIQDRFHRSLSPTLVVLAFALGARSPGQAQVEPSGLGFGVAEDPRWIVLTLREELKVTLEDGELRLPAGDVILPEVTTLATDIAPVFPEGSGLAHHYSIHSPDAGTTKALLDVLKRHPAVAEAHVPSRPAPSPASATPDFTGQQGYVGTIEPPPAFPPPVQLIGLRDVPGGGGEGVKIIDIEYAWQLAHEDLPASISVQGPTPRVPAGLDARTEAHHGTAGLGIVLGQHNGFGIDGVAPRAAASVVGSYTDTTQPYEVNLARAIDRARGLLAAGDVLLLEAQIGGPNWAGGASQVGVVPVEWQQVVFDAIRAATQKGIVVIEAAGNGSQNLDDPVYQGKFNRATRDSGAFLVTSIWATLFPPGSPPPYVSNQGSRVDFHFWSEPLVTTGYGDLQDSADDRSDYTSAAYGASSAASALLAGGVAALEGVARALLGQPLTATEVRDFLARTGAPYQGGTGPLLPHFGAAVAQLVYERLSLDPALAGVLLNSSFDLIQGVGGATPAAWDGRAFQYFSMPAFGSIQPPRGKKMLRLEDEAADGVASYTRSRFKLPVAATHLAIDWYLLTNDLDAQDPCSAVTGEIRIEDPATGDVLPVAMLDACEPLAADASHEAYTRGTGWRTSYSADLTHLRGQAIDLRIEIAVGGGTVRRIRAALLADRIRFESSAALALTGVAPSSGPVCGGTRLVVRGTGFTSGDSIVSLGGVPLLNQRWVDAQTIVGEAPPSSTSGAAALALSSPGGNASLAAAFTYLAGSCGVSMLRGDCNGDGLIDMSDPVASFGYLFRGGTAPGCERSCDSNGDAAHDIADGIFVLGYLFRGTAAPPAPFPGCGKDPTTTGLACVRPSCP